MASPVLPLQFLKKEFITSIIITLFKENIYQQHCHYISLRKHLLPVLSLQLTKKPSQFLKKISGTIPAANFPIFSPVAISDFIQAPGLTPEFSLIAKHSPPHAAIKEL